jgi:UDP-N-acetylmuramoylalanine--D-glutamate ligase
MYEALATQGKSSVHSGLAGIDSAKLKKLRSSHLKECFNLIDEMRHKLEFVARIKGVSFIDDAASRNVMSTWYALETIEGKAIWIANGAAPSANNVSQLKRLHSLAAQKVQAIITLGNSSVYELVFGDANIKVCSVETMGEAVSKAFYSCSENMKVLFSPAVENGISYETQGDSFKHEVNEL